ncbi:plasmid segregation protein ParM domain-containing protein [Escherichia coli]|uniref:plasmid segregation protein ParM domain-containing protein n=1 Tax=Escherichia coli TaxID=562 RepID=UPI00226D8BBE|nr:plasmid segregation protein ParM domain-containing protein [Escherichia coli]
MSIVTEAMNEALRKLEQRVLNTLNEFSGYTHVMVIGGGAEFNMRCSKKTQHRFVMNVFSKPITLNYDLVKRYVSHR